MPPIRRQRRSPTPRNRPRKDRVRRPMTKGSSANLGFVPEPLAQLPWKVILLVLAIWPPLVLIGIPAGLVMLQPDLGTALMITAGGITVMFLAGIPLRLFIGGGLAGAILAPIAFNFVLHDYQRNRILIFMDPESD